MMKSNTIISVLFAAGTLSLNAQVKFQPHIYIGGGIVRPIIQKEMDFQIESDIEQNYFAFNDSQGKKTKLHAHARLGLVEAGPFSIGYTFWGYRREYDMDFPELWATEFKKYPQRYDLSLHASYIQLDIPALTIKSLRAIPYLTAGIGNYFGSLKKIDFWLTSSDSYIYSRETETETFEGWAWMAGFGTVVLKRGYIQFELVDLRKKNLPAQRFFDVVIGVRI